MKPLKDYAPFKIGERFEDEKGGVLEIVGEDKYKCLPDTGRINTIGHRTSWGFVTGDFIAKPLDRTTSPKPWRDMTDDEKAPILLAWADGKSIEWWDDVVGAWCENGIDPQRWGKLAYRIAPEDVRESVCIMGRGRKWRHSWVDDATHKITFDTINGEPILDSIKMERLK